MSFIKNNLILQLEKLNKPIVVRFLDTNKDKVNPIDEYLKDENIINNRWLFWESTDRKHIFKVGYIVLCLVKLHDDFWLLTTIKEITTRGTQLGVNYDGIELTEYKDLFGRLIIKFHRKNQYQSIKFEKFKNKFKISQLLSYIYDGNPFPGYDKVSISYDLLDNIIQKNKNDWINALNNQKAVYLLTDCHTGKLYVGSATSSNGMLLSRWKNYLSTCHGGNKLLKELVANNGNDYFKQNFKFSIIENYNNSVDDKIILERESYWKDVLKTREFGYNDN